MSVTNFKLIALTMIEDHLKKIVDGEIRMNVANQHDPYVCESAIEVLSSDKYDDEIVRAVKLFQNADMNKVSAMGLAHTLSEFEPEELSRAWTD